MILGDASANARDWGTRTAPEIGEFGSRDGSVAVVPVGSLEQHGDHLPVATDTLLCDAVARRGASRVDGDVPLLVTPPLWTGLSPHHMAFGGTITLSAETMRGLLRDIAASVLDNGFDAVFFLNGHGGNRAVLGMAVTEVGSEFPDAQVLGLTYFDLAAPFVDEYRDSEVGGMAHGGEFETSLMLHLYPDHVDDDREATYMDEPYDLGLDDLFAGGPLSVYRSFDAYSESGAIGNPDLATAEKGAGLLDGIAEELAVLLTAVHEHNREA